MYSPDLLYIRERLIDDAPLSFFISCPSFLSQKVFVLRWYIKQSEQKSLLCTPHLFRSSSRVTR